MAADAYDLSLPETRGTSVVFASPHSGSDYPADFLARSVLDERAIRSSEDAFVDRLFAAATAHGAPLLAARVPRAYLDLNRSTDELDPALIDGVRSAAHNPRVSSGLGVIPRVVANGRTIYRGKIGIEEARARIRDHWAPYHARLSTLIDESLLSFGEAILIDCHSMPHEAIDSMSHPKGYRPDVVLGDRFGASARGDVMDRVEQAFAGRGPPRHPQRALRRGLHRAALRPPLPAPARRAGGDRPRALHGRTHDPAPRGVRRRSATSSTA